MSDIQTLNYSAHAIEEIKVFAAKAAKVMPAAAQNALNVIKLLQQAQKFIMPNRCDLFDPHETKQSRLDLFRLPYPVCVFEAPWYKTSVDGTSEPDTIDSPKRIALCWEPSVIDISKGQISQKYPQGGAFILPIYWVQTMGWVICVGGCFVPYESKYIPFDQDADVSEGAKLAAQSLIESGKVKPNQSKLITELFIAMPEIVENMVKKVGQDEVFKSINLDTQDEVRMALDACAVLNCENIGLHKVLPSTKLNQKREKAGKEPFDIYHVLEVSENKGQSTKKGGGSGGSHSSPKMHLRRGHIRRYEDGKTVWVKQSIVNAGSIHGSVTKEYRVKS